MNKTLLRALSFILLINLLNTPVKVYGQNPGVSITTFKNDAAGAYNIIHDDFGDNAVIGINNYVDTMTYNRNIKITFGAITSSCEGNPGMYAKAKSMINDHKHEIINHSHTHSCAIGSGACGGTGTNYQWAVPGSTERFNIEIDQSTQSILTNTGVQPRFFIYPYDQFNTNSNSYLESKGYIGSRTGNYNAASPGNFTPSSSGFFQTALVVDASDNGNGLVIAKNLNQWVDVAINNKQWVNRELHNVGDTGWGSVDVATYRNHLNYVKQKMDAGQLWVGTISELLTYQIQKLNYTPTSTYSSANKLITVNWNTPTFNVAQYLQNLQFKSPVTLKVDVSNAAHAGNYLITQNSISVTDYKKVGTNLYINVYPHEGPVKIQIVDCASLCIVTQPSSTTVLEGTPLTLTVQASGGTITYQWYKGGVAINGQTSSTLTIANTALSDAGSYYVRVTNGTNTLNSGNAVVSVTPNPCLSLCITQQPVNTSTDLGKSASFSVTAQGVQPITYKWYKNNVLIPSATGATYTINSAVLTDAGTYKVILTNSTGSVTSSEVTLTVYNQTPYSGSPIAIPGTFQAENFDNGGQNVSYFDNTDENEGGANYRNNEVDIETSTDGGAGYNIGYITNNEWLEYTVNVAATTNYNFIFRVASASNQGNGNIRLELDGQTVASNITFPVTGSWTSFTNSTFNNVPLTAGVHVLRIFIVNGDFNLNYVTVNPSSPIAPTVSFANNNISKTYGDASFTVSATSNSSGAITYSATGTGATVSSAGVVTITGAGTVTIKASQAASTPYTAGSATATITIAKKALTVKADNKSKPFNTANPTLTVTYSGFVGSDNASSLTTAPAISTDATTASPAGTYTITPSGAAAANYSFTYQTGILTVTAITPSITFSNINKVYGDAAFSLNVNSPSAGAVTYTATGTGASVNTDGHVTINGTGTVSVTASQAANGSYLAGTATATITIAKKALTVTADNKTKGYNSANPPLTITYSGFAYNETENNLTTKATATTTAVLSSPEGEYPITPAGAVSSNYTFTYVNGKLTVGPASQPTITLDNVSKVYGDVPFTIQATSTSNGAITYSITDGSGATITPAGLVTITEAGTVTVTASQEASGPYTAASTTATISIAKKSLTITADNKTKAYNTANPALTVKYSGFVYNETENNLTTKASATTSAQTNSPAGQYAIIPAGAVSSNYTFVYVNGKLTINQALTPVITFDDLTSVYGDAAFTVQANSTSSGAITYSITNGSAASITSAGLITINEAGTVTITATQAANGSYIGGTQSATLTISPKVLTVKADNKSKVYNEENPALTVTYSGFAYNESEVNLTSQAIAATDAVKSSNAGDYIISVAGASSSNYSFNYVTGTLTIAKASINGNINFTNASTGIEGSVIELTLNSTSVGTVTYYVTNGSGVATLSDNLLTLVSAGTISVLAVIEPGDNYEGGTISQVITISPLTSIGEIAGVSGLKLYPVPATDRLTFGFSLASQNNVRLELVEIETGRIIRNEEVALNSGMQEMPISVEDLTSGVYLLKIYVNEQMTCRKFSVMK